MDAAGRLSGWISTWITEFGAPRLGLAFVMLLVASLLLERRRHRPPPRRTSDERPPATERGTLLKQRDA